MSRGLQAFLYSRRNIVGSLLALGGLALHFVGLIAGLEWLPITVGLYLIGVLLVPAERSLVLALDAADDAAQVRDSLDRLDRAIRGRVPADIYGRVESIRASIMATLAANGGGALDDADPNVYLIRQTALSYLPEALNSYLALPRAFADRSLRGRPSAHDTLLQQLALMDGKMQEAVEALVQHDTDRLEAHGRFLAEKFGGSSLDLSRAGAPAATTGTTSSPAPAEGATTGLQIPPSGQPAAQSAGPPVAQPAAQPGPPGADERARERVR